MHSKHVVLITGSSIGFGRMSAESLARNGHIVFATMRDPEGRNRAKATEIQALAERESLVLQVLELDVTNDASVDRAVQMTVRRAGRLEVAINNAGYSIQVNSDIGRGLLGAPHIDQIPKALVRVLHGDSLTWNWDRMSR